MQSKPYDVVLIPEQEVADSAIKLSAELKVLDTHFVLDNKNFFPHISLYMLQLNERGLKETLDFLSTVAVKNKILEAKVFNYHYENDYLDIEYIKSKDFITLQKQIINGLNPIRDGLRERDKERLADATGETRENILKYGYRSVGNLFNPHLTFTRFKNNQESVIKTLPPKETFNSIYPSLGLFEMGDNGTCVKRVSTWELQSS